MRGKSLSHNIIAVKQTDVQPDSAELYLLPIESRMPIKFGHQVLSHVTCARVKVTVCDRSGRVAEGWGETPLAVEWGWPSTLSYDIRNQVMCRFCERLAQAWARFAQWGHPLELGQDFMDDVLPDWLTSIMQLKNCRSQCLAWRR